MYTAPLTSTNGVCLPHRLRPAGMEHVPLFSLAIITLLQLCRAELPGSWYSANVINSNGEFSPKPISEIFSTANPIVVLPSSTTSPLEAFSTLAQTATSSPFSSTASTYEYISRTASSYPTETSFDTQPTLQSTLPQQSTLLQQWTPSQPSIQTQQSTQPEQEPNNLGPFPFPVMPQPNKPQQNPPNYFLIYQQAPQNVQNFPTPAAQQTVSTFPTESTFSSQSSTTFRPDPTSFRPELTSFRPVSTSFRPDSTTFRPEFSSTFKPELSTQTTLSTFQPDSASTFPSNLPTRYSSTTRPFGSTAIPCDVAGKPLKTDNLPPKFPTLRIRMVAPSGSITNINVNPSVSTTTKRPTTTRRVTTTKTRRTKRNRNSYDGCVNTCDGKRSPICASPLSVSEIDPDTLKGFPSICHMACHNSFRKNQYEMLVEGRCGRLRTRIRTVDSKNKLKRDELNKVQYAIVENPQTVLEFASLPR